MSDLNHLFTPMKIGSIEVPNRIMMSPHTMIGMRNGLPEQEGYFETRARGGTGFIGIASCQVVSTPNLAQSFLPAYPGGDLQGVRAITDSVRRWDKKSFVQPAWMVQGAQPSALAPQSVLLDTQPRSMTLDEVHQIADAQGIAAANVQDVGVDAVEIPIGAARRFNISPRVRPTTAPTTTADRWRTGSASFSRSPTSSAHDADANSRSATRSTRSLTDRGRRHRGEHRNLQGYLGGRTP